VKSSFGALFGAGLMQRYALGADVSIILRVFSAELMFSLRRLNSAESAVSTCLFEAGIISVNRVKNGTVNATQYLYPAALWFGKASVERRIYLLHGDDPVSCSVPQFSSSFCPRTMLTAQRAFLCAVRGLRFCMMGVVFPHGPFMQPTSHAISFSVSHCSDCAAANRLADMVWRADGT